MLRNVDIEKDGEFGHQLVLRDTKTNIEKLIYSYFRRVDVLWSKDSKGLIINDRGGSDYANCAVFQFNKGIEKYNLAELLTKQAIRYKESIVRNHHVYIEGKRWITNKKIKVRISGYGDVDPGGFSIWYDYTVGGKFKFISKESPYNRTP